MKVVRFQLNNAENILKKAGYSQWDNGWQKEDEKGRFHAQLSSKFAKPTRKSPRQISTFVSLHYDTLIRGYHTVLINASKLLKERDLIKSFI